MTKRKQKIHTIYDRIGKKCISLSKRSTVQLINGLYGKNYPEDSEVTYNWTEHHDDDLRRTLADTIITINDTESYHMEMQMPLEELKQKKLIALLPFQILRLRKEIEKERTPQNMQALKQLIFRDIIGSIYENADAGNISLVESSKLLEMTLKLYKHLYEGYIELEENGMNEMIEDALILETEKFEKKMKVLESKNEDLERMNQALHMMLKGKSDQEIMEATGFSKEELEELRK